MTSFQCCLALVFITLLSPGLALLSCNVTIMLRDLGGILHWDCPALSPNTTFTVLEMTQGEKDFKEVGGCVQVTSWSCDISHTLSQFDLFHYVRLRRDESTQWTDLPKFLPSAESVYSPPTLSVSVEGSNLTVVVQFPCSPVKRCLPEQCCPVSVLVFPWTNITVYNELRPSERLTHTMLATEEMVRYEFWGLIPGQRYCAVANYTSSPHSSPCCVSLPLQTEHKSFWLVGGLFVFAVVPIVYFLKQQWQSTEAHLPRALVSLQEWVPTDPAIHCDDLQKDCEGDHLSILSVSPPQSNLTLTPLPLPPEAQADCTSQGDGYSSNPFPMDSGSGQMDWDSGSMWSDMPTPDYSPSDALLPLDCIVAPCLSQEDSCSPPETRRGSAVAESSPLRSLLPGGAVQGHRVVPDIPLISVRLAECEEEELEDLGWCHLTLGHSEHPR